MILDKILTCFLEVVADLTRQARSVIMTGDVNSAYVEIDPAQPKENMKKC